MNTKMQPRPSPLGRPTQAAPSASGQTSPAESSAPVWATQQGNSGQSAARPAASEPVSTRPFRPWVMHPRAAHLTGKGAEYMSKYWLILDLARKNPNVEPKPMMAPVWNLLSQTPIGKDNATAWRHERLQLIADRGRLTSERVVSTEPQKTPPGGSLSSTAGQAPQNTAGLSEPKMAPSCTRLDYSAYGRPVVFSPASLGQTPQMPPPQGVDMLPSDRTMTWKGIPKHGRGRSPG